MGEVDAVTGERCGLLAVGLGLSSNEGLMALVGGFGLVRWLLGWAGVGRRRRRDWGCQVGVYRGGDRVGRLRWLLRLLLEALLGFALLADLLLLDDRVAVEAEGLGAQLLVRILSGRGGEGASLGLGFRLGQMLLGRFLFGLGFEGGEADLLLRAGLGGEGIGAVLILIGAGTGGDGGDGLVGRHGDAGSLAGDRSANGAADGCLCGAIGQGLLRRLAVADLFAMNLLGLVGGGHGLAVLLGVLLAWEIRRLFQKLAAAYSLQIEEVKRRGDESFAREQWLNTTLRSIGDAVIACDPEGNVVFMNRVAEQLTGWQEPEADGLPLSQIFVIQNQRTRAAVENPVEVVRRSGKIVGLANHTVLISKDLNELQIDDSAAPILDANSRMIGIVLVFRDITERHAAELALMRAEKLAAAGRLAAAIAHEVNNPLEGLVNLIYLARGEQTIEKIRRHLAEADRELQRIAHITRQSLGFYREPSSAGLFRPDVVAREVFEFYSSRAASARVSLHVKLNTEQQVFGNSGELRQVLSNLLANSLDACREGDAVCVRVRAGGRVSAGAGVRITLADSGSGIRPENLKRIFEPFYTTKKDTGTGLGLWVSRELIEKCGGRLNVRSSVAEGHSGTVFTIFLPSAVPGALLERSGPRERMKIG